MSRTLDKFIQKKKIMKNEELYHQVQLKNGAWTYLPRKNEDVKHVLKERRCFFCNIFWTFYKSKDIYIFKNTNFVIIEMIF